MIQSSAAAVIREAMRIGGKHVDTDDVLEVHYPYTNEVIGTVPAARRTRARAFAIAQVQAEAHALRAPADSLPHRRAAPRRRKDDFRSDHPRTRPLLEGLLYEVGRAYDVCSFAGQLAILDDGQIFSCDLTPRASPARFSPSASRVGVISAITPFNHPLNMVSPQGGAGHRHQQLRGAASRPN